MRSGTRWQTSCVVTDSHRSFWQSQVRRHTLSACEVMAVMLRNGGCVRWEPRLLSTTLSPRQEMDRTFGQP